MIRKHPHHFACVSLSCCRLPLEAAADADVTADQALTDAAIIPTLTITAGPSAYECTQIFNNIHTADLLSCADCC
jgi:hypothetical protein